MLTRNGNIFFVIVCVMVLVAAIVWSYGDDKKEDEPQPQQWEAGTCLDREKWVGESRQLNGTFYIKVIEKSINSNYYIVVTCEFKDGVDNCSELHTIGGDYDDDYEWIHCPK